jgi:hypothetical protein
MEYQIFVVGTVNGRREATCWAGQTWSVGPAKACFRPAGHSVESITAQDDDNFGCQHLLILLFFAWIEFLAPMRQRGFMEASWLCWGEALSTPT